MDTIWKKAAKKQCTRDLCDATVTSTLTTPVQTTLPVTTTTTPKWCDPETVTLEQIDENTRRLLREWPKDDGIPFPMEILKVLRDLNYGRSLAKNGKKAAKIAYQRNYYGAAIQISVLTQSKVQPVTAITPTFLNSSIPVPTRTRTPASTPARTPVPARIPVPIPTPALPPPVGTSTLNSNPIAAFESDTAATAPTPSPASTTTTNLSSATTTGPTRVVIPTAVEQRGTKQPDNKESKERTGEEEDERQERRGENKEEHKDEEKAKQEAMKEACPQTGRDDATRHQLTPFDWATDIDRSISPVPSASNFRPTKPPSPWASPKPAPRLPDNSVTPSQPIHARTPTPTDCTPAAYTPAALALVDPDPGDMANKPIPADPAPALHKPALVNPDPTPSHSAQASSILVDPAPIDMPNVPNISAHVTAATLIFTLRATSQVSNWAHEIHGAVSITAAITFTHLESATHFHLQNNFGNCLTCIQAHIRSRANQHYANHLPIQTHIHLTNTIHNCIQNQFNIPLHIHGTPSNFDLHAIGVYI
ncbi:hypothetical protein PILCRDRAFT_91035 [Piloderma croceum F 1598]|uniref:Uncharacterized protein n=1 Tax=Piloderma croceum (strain F 1598) TaxID=765440 RepID=A0A0C3EYY8_PILCF|nr:hypothetical protein PILCRDRAFT_91035 [Piloderma croceum F 1598]